MVSMACAASNENTLSDYEERSGWQLLFDGKSTTQWRNYQSREVSEGWKIEDGILSCTPGAGDLITKAQFDNFELSLDYRISAGGNSGVLFHVTEDGKKPWHSGPEIQLLDNQGHQAKEKSGWLYQLYQPEVPAWSLRARKAVGIEAPVDIDATRPAGQWNQLYLRVSKSQCQVALNGVSYYFFSLGDDEWNRRVAKSKFARFANFGKAGTGHICLQDHRDPVSFRNIKLRKLSAGGDALRQPIDGQLPLVAKPAFPQLTWKDWEPVNEEGQVSLLRIMELTHAGDQRLFAATQRGRIYVFDNDPNVKSSEVFLDIQDRVAPWRKHNEEGLLGLAMHPHFANNGYCFVYYTSREMPLTSVLSRFTASDRDPRRADPDSEVVLMRIKQPFHNHNGGCIEFGPDGYLYVALGDGGDRNDPFGHGQDLSSWLGAILRIDVDRPSNDAPYSIPADNPFLNVPNAKPEIYAHGLRNVWRMAFDRATGELWAADVGQDLWEEINLVQRGGNYGWNVREGQHPFGNALLSTDASTPREPVWEYDHRIGKSITGGRVYRGKRLPELHGRYLYADYVSGRIWALQYDADKRRVAKNHEIVSGGIPALAFGEDAEGEVYCTTAAASSRCILRFERQTANQP